MDLIDRTINHRVALKSPVEFNSLRIDLVKLINVESFVVWIEVTSVFIVNLAAVTELTKLIQSSFGLLLCSTQSLTHNRL